MKVSKKIMMFIALLATLMFVAGTALTSCQPAPPPATETAAPETEAAETEAAEETAAAAEKTFWQMINDGDLKFEGVTLNFLYQGGVGYDKYMEATAKEFEELTGAKVVLDPTPWEAQMPKIVNDVQTGANQYDLFEGDIEFQYTLKDQMIPINDYIEKYNVDIEGFFDGVYKYGEWLGQGIRYGLPIGTGISSVAINTEIFDAAGVKYPFATWDDFYAGLEKLTDKSKGIYGITFSGVNAQLVKMYLSRLWGQEVDVYNKNWLPQVNTPGGIKAAQMMVDLMKYAPPGVLGWDVADAAPIFLEGKAAIYENWLFAIAGLADDPEQSKIAGKWTLIPAAGGGPTGNWVEHNVDILKSSENPEAAFAYLAYITSTERIMDYFKNPVEGMVWDPARTQVWTELLIPATPQLQGQFDALQAGIPITPGLPQWLEAFMAIGDNNGTAMAGTATPEEAMENLFNDLNTIIQSNLPGFEYPAAFE
ncbi:MAG: extracellular solute-binding protein [Actinobacteria bacterium]|nr:extracellular solute-binding protein [Actinomycetota bacterium]